MGVWLLPSIEAEVGLEILTLTSKADPYKLGFGPFAPEVYRLTAIPILLAYRWTRED